MGSQSKSVTSAVRSDVDDRSSLGGDYLVVIEGQTEQEWWQRRPRDQFCEFLDGLIDFPRRRTARKQNWRRCGGFTIVLR
ncbi:MAG: hypothetical protein JWN86_1690 [Planctomycetota bacterium]|nr:hypothetical protein [Planctomycetota bacterium]